MRLFITTALALYLRLWQHLCQWYGLIYAIIPARFFLELKEVKLRLILNSYVLVVAMFKTPEAMLSRVFSRQQWSGVFRGQGKI